MIEKNTVCNPQLETRNPQRIAFKIEPLTGVIKAEPFGLGYLLDVNGTIYIIKKNMYIPIW